MKTPLVIKRANEIEIFDISVKNQKNCIGSSSAYTAGK